MRMIVLSIALFALIPVLLLGNEVDKKTDQQKRFETPKIILDTVDKLVEELPNKGRKQIFKMKSEDGMVGYHLGWGAGIRNSLGLWGDSELSRAFKTMGIWHADDMSGILLNCVWRRIHQKDLNIEQQVEYYKAYWKENKELINEPCPVCSKTLEWRMSFPLIQVLKPETIKTPQPNNPKEIQKMIQWYRCPEGHEFIWTSATGLRTPDAAQIEARRKLSTSGK